MKIKTAEEVLREYVKFDDPNGNETVELLTLTIIDAMIEYADIYHKQHLMVSENAIPYQLCPKCNGQGMVSKPPYIAGDINIWSSSASSFPCNVCNGAKIIPMLIK